MSSSGLIYAVIVGAWAAYLVPMWLRRQDELNEARPTERFSTAIRLLSGRAGMERRYAKDLQARSPEEGESRDPDNATGSVDVRAFVAPPHRQGAPEERPAPQGKAPVKSRDRQPSARPAAKQQPAKQQPAKQQAKPSVKARVDAPEPTPAPTGARPQQSAARRAASAEAAARARRTKVLARRRRTTVMLFVAFTLGAVVAAVGGLAFLWVPAVPAALLSAYIVYLRGQERRRFTYTMDQRRAEVAAQRLRERQPRRRAAGGGAEAVVDDAEEGPGPDTEAGLSALAADRRALVEQTDHAEWVDQQRERQRRPGHGDSWDPVPVPLPTYVTAPVAPRATGDVDLSAPDAWSSARSSSVEPAADEAQGEAEESEYAEYGEGAEAAEGADGGDGRSDARRAASARRARERGRTPLFDQYEEGERPRAANE
ncbi:gephyrin-like molybdotransferase receptor GlpR [Streptomyces sp. NPDC046853]|uniref:divisome protein SepX/GlpR n=1 Tax=Streptomyces sp. NPDC046853 TaxID=3154920 RepID=UPI0033CBDBF2